MRNVNETRDVAVQATMMQHNRKASLCCPLCAQVRRVETLDGETGLYCPRCGDFVPTKGPGHD